VATVSASNDEGTFPDKIHARGLASFACQVDETLTDARQSYRAGRTRAHPFGCREARRPATHLAVEIQGARTVLSESGNERLARRNYTVRTQ